MWSARRVSQLEVCHVASARTHAELDRAVLQIRVGIKPFIRICAPAM